MLGDILPKCTEADSFQRARQQFMKCEDEKDGLFYFHFIFAVTGLILRNSQSVFFDNKTNNIKVFCVSVRGFQTKRVHAAICRPGICIYPQWLGPGPRTTFLITARRDVRGQRGTMVVRDDVKQSCLM